MYLKSFYEKIYFVIYSPLWRNGINISLPNINETQIISGIMLVSIILQTYNDKEIIYKFF